MEPVLQSLTAGLPVLILHFAVTVAMWLVGLVAYHWMTPYPEIRLIRDGNLAAAVATAGAVVSLALPLAFCMAVSVNSLDIVAWGTVTLVIMLAVYKVVDLLIRDLPRRISAGEVGPALVLSAVKLGMAAIIAAAVSG